MSGLGSKFTMCQPKIVRRAESSASRLSNDAVPGQGRFVRFLYEAARMNTSMAPRVFPLSK